MSETQLIFQLSHPGRSATSQAPKALAEDKLPEAVGSTKIAWEELQVGERLGEGTWGPTFEAEQICSHGLHCSAKSAPF